VTKLEPVIGLEVHAELQTRSKMFCACAVVDSTSAAPNTAVCETCTGLPGTLPAVNARAVEFALRVALALHAVPAERSIFARKNYFYPDLPKGFQISQYELPLASGGWLDIETPAGPRRVRIRRVHLEEDTGKLFHRQGHSLVDYNRSGVPLLEIVTEPDLHSLEDIKAYATELRSVLRTLEVNSGDMEKGVIRFEANVSLRRSGDTDLGTRTEIKNLNSFRSMLRAVAYEIERQTGLLNAGQPVTQETVGWNEATGETFSQRGKEEAHDYRYFQEPDLPPLLLETALVARIQANLPELPSERRMRWRSQYGLTPALASVLSAEPAHADYFEAARAAAGAVPPERIAHWLVGELFGLLNAAGMQIAACPIRPADLADLVSRVEEGTLTASNAKMVLGEMFSTGASPEPIIARRGLSVVEDVQAVRQLVDQVLASHPEQVAEYRGGKTAIEQWLFGQVMRLAGGRAHPASVRQALREALSSAENRQPGL